jgi:hypothetical protein
MHKAIIYIVLLLQVKTDKVSTSFRRNGVERVITTIRCLAIISSDSLLWSKETLSIQLHFDEEAVGCEENRYSKRRAPRHSRERNLRSKI